ncbi:MAG: glycosyltransferase [Bacteroidia bacterium]|nr:glycosyltransferase [Bacteroidia bacterium]MDW8134226.1 glycosyltransferase [Bacteroidia bacterium]
MSKIRVLLIISRLNVGGAAQHVLLLARNLKPSQYEVLIVAGQEPAGEIRAQKWIEAYEVPIIYIPSMQREPSWQEDMRALFYLWRLMRRWKPHIVHTHTAKAGALGRIAAWLAGVPVRIHTFHGHSFRGYFSSLLSRIYLQIERLLARLTHRIIALSEGQKQELAESYRVAPPKKIVVIPLGLPLDTLNSYDAEAVSKLRAQWQKSEAGLLLGWTGRLVPIKRVDRLIRALPELVKRFPNLRLVIVGEGPERTHLERSTHALSLEERIVWAGLRWDIPVVLRALDALVLVSDNEGTPVSLIEGLACGVPVAALPVGGVPDILEKGKWGFLLYEPLEKSLEEFLLSLPAYKARAESAQKYIQEKYGEKRLLRDIEDLYSSLYASTKP